MVAATLTHAPVKSLCLPSILSLSLSLSSSLYLSLSLSMFVCLSIYVSLSLSLCLPPHPLSLSAMDRGKPKLVDDGASHANPRARQILFQPALPSRRSHLYRQGPSRIISGSALEPFVN